MRWRRETGWRGSMRWWSTTRCPAQVARRFREAGFSRPIIICSAYLTPEVEREATTFGAETVTKCDLEALVETVRREVQG